MAFLSVFDCAQLVMCIVFLCTVHYFEMPEGADNWGGYNVPSGRGQWWGRPSRPIPSMASFLDDELSKYSSINLKI